VVKSQGDLLNQMQRYTALKQDAVACEIIHNRLSDLTQTAVGRKELAEFTLRAFEVDLLGAQQSLRTQTQGLVDVRHAMRQAYQQRQREERERRQRMRNHEVQQAAAKLVQEARKKFMMGKDRSQQRDREKIIAAAEGQLNRLALASGLKDPCGEVEQLMMKFEQRGETSRDLRVSSEKLLGRLSRSRQVLETHEAEMQKFGQSPSSGTTWRTVDETAAKLESTRHRNQFKAELLMGEIMQCHELQAGFDTRVVRIESVIAASGQAHPRTQTPAKELAKWKRSMWGEPDHVWVPTPTEVVTQETLQSFERMSMLALTLNRVIQGYETQAATAG